MIWTRQAPFPSHTYRAVLQLPHALGENKLPLALSFSWRTVLSLARSSLLALGQPHGVGGWEWQQPEVLWAADPVWAGTKSHRSGSAGTKWGQTVRCSCWNDGSAGGAGKLLQVGFKREWTVGRSECLAVRGYLWKGRPLLAGARIQAHPHRVGQWHCWAAAAVVIHRVCFETHLVSYTCGTIHGMDCQESESAKMLPLINAISHFLHSI